MYYKVDFLIKKNKIGSEEIYDKNVLEKEPIGDWQSPSDNERWNSLYKELQQKRIKYNIDNSHNAEEEKEFFIKTKKVIDQEVLHLFTFQTPTFI
jgi:hypothetical protein